MEDTVFLEEEKNLIDNLNRIDLLISRINQKIDSYNYELDKSENNNLIKYHNSLNIIK